MSFEGYCFKSARLSKLAAFTVLGRFCAVLRGMACAAIPDLLAGRPRRFDGDLSRVDGWGGSISRWSAPSVMGPRVLDGHPGYLGICRANPRRSGPSRAGSRSAVLLAHRARGNPRYGRHGSRADLVDPQQTRHGPLLSVGLAILDYPSLSRDSNNSDHRGPPQNLCDENNQCRFGLARLACTPSVELRTEQKGLGDARSTQL